MRAKDCFHCGHGVQKFADFTTMHGFREFYYAKSAFWKIVWFLIIATAIALSIYQLYNTIVQALQQPMSTVIQPLDQDTEYPPLKICYLHWMYWVNWDLVYKLGFDRNTLLFAASYLSDIVSDQTFNFTQAKSDFTNAMKKNDFVTLTQFYSAISTTTPPGISVTDLQWTNWTKIIDPGYGRLCYIADKTMIKNGLEVLVNKNPDNKDKITLVSHYDNSGVDFTYIHQTEVVLYMQAYILTLLSHPLPPNVTVNYLGFKAAPVLTVDNVKVSLVMPSKETFQSIIKITGTVYEWLNTNKRPCNPGDVKWYYDYCEKICLWEEIQRQNPNGCLNIEGAVLFNKDTVENLCNHNVMFVDSMIPTVVPGNYITTLLVPTTQPYNTCIAQYCMAPCVQWEFASTVSNLPVPTEFAFLNFPTTIYIEYPSKAAILVISEVVSQTWETVIGNLGGIFGLWIGASIMSILQMFYLLCCEHCDEKMADSCCHRRSKLIDVKAEHGKHFNLEPRKSIHNETHGRPKTVVVSSSLMSKNNPYPYSTHTNP